MKIYTVASAILAATLITACGGGSSGASSAIEDPAIANDVPGDNISPIEPLISNDGTQSTVEDNPIVCGATRNEFSYEIFITGNDFTGFHDTGFSIQSPKNGFGWNDNAFCDMDNSIGVDGIAALIPQAASIPEIDGSTDYFDPQWLDQGTATSIIDGILDESLTSKLLVSNVPGYLDDSRSGDWFALHNNENLYIRFLARNESSNSGNNQLFRDSDDPRDDDSIDIFIDGDNSKGTSYDGTNDFHITLPRLNFGSQVYYGTNSAEGLIINYQNAPVGDFNFYEIEINLESAGIVPGTPFGFEIQLNDDDNGGPVDARFGWFEQTGSSVADSNPSVFGTALLTGCPDATYCGTEQLLDPSLSSER